METTNLNNSNPVSGTNTGQTIIVNQTAPEKNGIGVAGFVMSITGMILCWVPVLKWLLLIPAFILSFIGIFRKPRALAIIGSIISLLVIIILIAIKVSFLIGIASL